MTDDLDIYDAIALGEFIERGEIRPAELLEITIQRIEKVNPKLNAVIHKMYDEAHQFIEKENPRKTGHVGSLILESGQCADWDSIRGKLWRRGEAFPPRRSIGTSQAMGGSKTPHSLLQSELTDGPDPSRRGD
jgi:hypothetical protein